ncbi:MAG: methyltransferase domain-containing protein [Candidatus Eremiobacterota bacterium]
MKAELAELLVCPDCRGNLLAEPAGPEILEGYLHCPGCRTSYPVRNGIPRFVEGPATGFEYQWQVYRQLDPLYERQFLDWLQPVEAPFFQGKLVLDAGCGKGRHAVLAGRFGARMVVGVDLTRAVDVARANAGGAPGLEFVQADLLRLPFRDGTFDYAYSIGVLHHLSDPGAGFQAVKRRVKPGGHLSAWVYGRENNGWIVHFLNPLREHLFSRLPPSMLHSLARLGAAVIKLVARGFYAPVLAMWPAAPLFYREYLMYIGNFPFREIETIVFDHLHPTFSHYLRREAFEGWFEGLEEVRVGWHNRNSWRGFARIPQ